MSWKQNENNLIFLWFDKVITNNITYSRLGETNERNRFTGYFFSIPVQYNIKYRIIDLSLRSTVELR